MKTDQLIAALAADGAVKPPHRLWRLGVLPAIAVAIALIAVVAELGIRADLASALQSWRFPLKFVLALALAALALWQALALYRPQHKLRLAVLLPVLLGLAAAVGIELLMLPGELWLPRLRGSTAAVCMVAIPTLSLLPLAAILFGLRGGAPASPTKAGAMAGLAASAMATSVYALHCIEDSPLFVLTWYVLAILIVTAAGALIGRRLLRW